MCTEQEKQRLAAVAAMAAHHGTYTHLVLDPDDGVHLAHRPQGEVLYEFPRELQKHC